MIVPRGPGDRRAGGSGAGRAHGGMGSGESGDPGGSFGGDDPLQLSFADAEAELPWLVAEEGEDEPAIAAGRIALFALAVCVVAGLLAAGLWLVLHRVDRARMADGSVIEAPPGPYKVRPENAGGRRVEGTGATSFEVGQGRRVEVRVAAQDVPVVVRGAPPAAASGAGAEAGTEAGSGASGLVGVQLAAYPTREAAEAGWRQLGARFEQLQGRGHRILEGRVDGGVIYRLQAIAGDAAAAHTLCSSLRASGGDCQVRD